MVSLVFYVAVAFAASVVSGSCLEAPNGLNGWVVDSHPDPDFVLRFTVVLRRRNEHLMEQELMAVSDPRSPRYGQHYTLNDVAAKFGASDEAIHLVEKWLHPVARGNIDFSRGRDYARVHLKVSDAENLFNIKLMKYTHPLADSPIIRSSTPFCVPAHLSKVLAYVDGLFSFPQMGGEPTLKFQRKADVAQTLQPKDLVVLYSITEATDAVYPSSQAPVQFGKNYYSASDLQTFEKLYVPEVIGQKITEVYGTNLNTKTSVEANLDVQYIIATGNFVNTSLYIQPCGVLGNVENCFLDYTYVVGNQTSPPLVQSISYGQYGGDYNNQTVQRLNQEFMLMGLRGISILLASGDNGVGCNSDCTSFEFDFPSSPYITMVGATYVDRSSGIEKGATLSSGGFSLDYYRPSYQDTAVNGYFNSGVSLPDPSMYYRNGRAYPDVAAAGEDLTVVVDGKSELVSGTSCSAPIFAGIISLLNNDRFLSGKSPLGFLNPWIYQNPSMFNPINSGNNKYCNSNCCCSGFNAADGWDPVTGLGTPNHQKMRVVSASTP